MRGHGAIGALAAILLAAARLMAQNQPGDATAALTARRVRLWDSTAGPIAVVPYRFAIMLDPASGSGRERPISVTFSLRQFDGAGGETDSAWTAALLPPHTSREPHVASGYVVVPSPLGLTSWNLSAVSDAAGADATASQSGQSNHPGSTILLSDFLLGSASNGLAWERGNGVVLVGVSDTFPRRDVMHVYYQIQSDAPHADVRTTLTVTNVTRPGMSTGRLQIYFTGRLAAGINAADRELDLSRLKVGRYLLELQVGDLHGGGAAVWSAYFVVI